MPPTTYLALRKGSQRVILQDGGSGGSPLRLQQAGWAPNVATRRPSPLGGIGMLNDVAETIPLIAVDDPASVLGTVAAARRLIDDADLWRRYPDREAPVYLECVPAGSARSISDPLSALVLGPDRDRATGLPPRFSRSGGVLDGVDLRLLRRGPWLAAGESQTTTASAGAKWSVTFADHGEYSPCQVAWTIPATSPSIPATYFMVGSGMLMTDSAGDLEVWDDASFASPSGSWSTSVQSNALGGNVRRLSPGAANTYYATDLNIPTSLQTAGLYYVYASLRSSSASAEWSMYLKLRKRSDEVAETEPVTWSRGSGTPDTCQLVPLGILSIASGGDGGSGVPAVADYFQLLAAASTTSGSPVLDVDYLVVMRAGAGAFAQRYNQIRASNAAADFGAGAALQQRILPATPSRLIPRCDVIPVSGSAGEMELGYSGSRELWQRGTTVAGVWVAGTSDTYSTGLYRARNASGIHTASITVTRYRAYAMPE